MNTTEPAARPKRARRFPRWPIVLVVVLVVLVAGFLLAARFLVDPERYRGRIEQALEQSTGWNAQLESIDLNLGFGGAALAVSPARLAAPGADSSTFRIETLSVHASLIPLLSGRLEIQSLELGSPSIVLVRESVEQGWVVPALGGGGSSASASASASAALPARTAGLAWLAAADAADGGSGSGFQVMIDRVAVDRGQLRLIDRTFDPPRELELSEVEVAGSLLSGRVEGSASLAGAPVSIDGLAHEELRIDVSGLPTEALAIAPGGDLVHAGGALDGQIRVRWPEAVEADLTARNLAMLAGSEPLDQATASFEVVPAPSGNGWRMDGLSVRAGEAVLEGAGALTPALELAMSVDEAPVDDAIRALRAVAPVPVEIRGPGRANAAIDVAMAEGGEADVRVDGHANAAELRLGGPLPPARDVGAHFAIEGTRTLTIDIGEGRVAGGPLRGTLRMKPLAPPGELTFEGELEDAAFGELLRGFAGDEIAQLSGPTDLDADVALDLSGETIDPLALTGALSLRAREVTAPGWDLESALRGELEQQLGDLGRLASLLGRGLSGSGGETADAGAEEPSGKGVLESLAGSVRLEGDVWKLDPVSLVQGDVSASGDGELRPGSMEMNLQLRAHLDAEETSKLVEKHGALRHLVDGKGRLTFPVRVGGRVTSPSFSVDLGELVDERSLEGAVEGAIKDLFD